MNVLLNCIQNETMAMAGLVELLCQEQTVLSHAPTPELMEEINGFTQKKHQLISDIAQLVQLRTKELIRAGFKPEETSVRQWFQNKAEKESWEKLIEQIAKANELNRVNGLLITRHLARNQSTLDVLYKNQQAGSAPALYGANGQSGTQRNNGRGVVV